MNKTAILLVEDEYDFGFILKQYLEVNGFSVYWFQNPLEVLGQVSNLQNCQIAILDVMLPDMDGFTLAQKLQEKLICPFLFLTAKNQQIDRILGLKLGADDYIAKPCDPEELILRLNNILKRQENEITIEEIHIGSYVFRPKQFVLSYTDINYQLTEREVDLLLLLIQYNNQIITRNIILQSVWKATDYFSGRSMDVFISRLRKYFRHDKCVKIQSVRGVGFQLFLALNNEEAKTKKRPSNESRF